MQARSGSVRRAGALQENAAIRGLDDGERTVPVARLVPGSGAASDPHIAGPARVAVVPYEGAEDNIERTAQAVASPGSKRIKASP